MTGEEAALLRQLLNPKVEGYSERLKEAEGAMVEDLKDDDTLFLKVPESDSPGFHSTISEAEYVDIDGVKTYLSVHIVHGRLHELEIYKEDGSLLRAPIRPDNVQIIWPT